MRLMVENMNAATAWNLRGIGYETRLAAEQAARLAGMSLGEWLEDIIAQQAAEDAVDEPNAAGSFKQDLDGPSTTSFKSSRIASPDKNGGVGPFHSARASKRANDNEHAISMALLDRIDALEKRLTSHFGGEAARDDALPAPRADRPRAQRPPAEQTQSLRSFAARRPADSEDYQGRPQDGPPEMEKIKSTVLAMHRLLEVISRKLARVEDDAGYTRRFLEARDPEIGVS
jgi:hypothetical protein